MASAVEVNAVRTVWDQALSAPDWAASPVWLHGDLHPANVVTVDGTLWGLLDFGDISSGDRARLVIPPNGWFDGMTSRRPHASLNASGDGQVQTRLRSP